MWSPREASQKMGLDNPVRKMSIKGEINGGEFAKDSGKLGLSDKKRRKPKSSRIKELCGNLARHIRLRRLISKTNS